MSVLFEVEVTREERSTFLFEFCANRDTTRVRNESTAYQ